MAGHVVGFAGARVDAGQCTFVFEQQRLVGSVELGGLEGIEVGSAGIHEADGAIDFGSGLFVALVAGVRCEETAVPVVHEPQICETALGERTNEVKRRCGDVVRLEQTLRIVATGFLGELIAVDDVAAERRQGDSVAGLHIGRARLRELTGHTADLHHGHRTAVGEHCSHLQNSLHTGPDLVSLSSVEGFGAVAAGQDEGLTARGSGNPLLEHIGFTGEDQRRRVAQVGEHLVERGAVEIRRLLLRIHLSPVVETAEVVVAGSGDFSVGQNRIGVETHCFTFMGFRCRSRSPRPRRCRGSL